jgi:hypothetical protein
VETRDQDSVQDVTFEWRIGKVMRRVLGM